MNWFQKLTALVSRQRKSPQKILLTFQEHRQELQNNCFGIAAASGKPRGLKWAGADWLESYALVEDPTSKLITLFQGVNLTFEAIEGGDMEDVAAVSTVREAVAVFHLLKGRWGTGGQFLFNMTPMLAAQTVGSEQTLLASDES